MSDPRPDSRAIVEEALRLNALRPRKLRPDEIDAEKKRCTTDLIYFVRKYAKIYDNITASWIAFDLWPDQEAALLAMEGHKYILEPKARQNGASWKSAARAL